MLGWLTGWIVSCWQMRQLDSVRPSRIYSELRVCVISSKPRNGGQGCEQEVEGRGVCECVCTCAGVKLNFGTIGSEYLQGFGLLKLIFGTICKFCLQLLLISAIIDLQKLEFKKGSEVNGRI